MWDLKGICEIYLEDHSIFCPLFNENIIAHCWWVNAFSIQFEFEVKNISGYINLIKLNLLWARIVLQETRSGTVLIIIWYEWRANYFIIKLNMDSSISLNFFNLHFYWIWSILGFFSYAFIFWWNCSVFNYCSTVVICLRNIFKEISEYSRNLFFTCYLSIGFCWLYQEISILTSWTFKFLDWSWLFC